MRPAFTATLYVTITGIIVLSLFTTPAEHRRKNETGQSEIHADNARAKRLLRAWAIRQKRDDPTVPMTPAERAGAEQAALELELGVTFWDPLSQRADW